MSIFTVPMTIRSTQRLGQIGITLIRHGFGPFVRRIKLQRYIPWSRLFYARKPSRPRLPEEEPTLGRRLVASLEEMGPIYVKLGQLLSSRPDVVPPELLEDLKLLQDQVSPFPTQQAIKIIEEELGKDIDSLYLEFNRIPLASGSIAQTYLAKTHDCRQVVVKVRRPQIEQTAKLDIYLLRWIAGNMEKYIPELHLYRPMEIIEEFEQTLNREMDLLNEAAMTDRVHNYFRSDSRIVVPSVCWDLTSTRVMTMSYITGRHFHEVLSDTETPLNKPQLARVLIETFMNQVLELGAFHADPHPGNFLILPPDRIGLVDFGMAGQLDRQRSATFILLLATGNYRYMDIVMDLLSDMDALTPETDVEMLKRDLITLLDKYKGLPLKHMKLQIIFNEIISLAREYHVHLPRDFILIGKSIVVMGGTALLLDPTLDPTEVIGGKVREMLIKLFGKEHLSRQMILAFWHGGLLLKEMPHQLRQFSRQLLRGQLKIQMEVPHMEELIQELDHTGNRLSFAIIIAAIIIGSSLIFQVRLGPTWYGLPLLGLTGYLIAGIMGLWLVIAIIRSGKLS